MNEIFLILLAGGIVLAVGYPLVKAYSKWKKEMQEEAIESEDE